MTANPYQSPATLDHQPLARQGHFGFEHLQSDGRALFVRGLGLLRFGYALLFAVTLCFALLMLARSGDVGTGARVVALAAMAIGFLVTLWATALWTSVKGKHRATTWLAVILQALSMLALLAFFQAIMGGRFANGLLRLFGASALAMLLTSQALVAILIRAWAISRHDDVSTHAGEVAVFAFAGCAAVCSLLSLQPISFSAVHPAAMSTPFFSAIVATGAMGFAAHRLRKQT